MYKSVAVKYMFVSVKKTSEFEPNQVTYIFIFIPKKLYFSFILSLFFI